MRKVRFLCVQEQTLEATTDSGQVDVAAPSEAAAPQSDATHGEATDIATDQVATPDATADTTESTSDTDDGDEDSEESESTEPQTEEEKTESQKRRERRERREAERVEKLVQDRLDQAERDRATKASQAEIEAKAKQENEAWQKRFGELVGTPEIKQSLDQEIAALTREITGLRPYADGTDLDVLEQKQTILDQKISARDRLAENQKLYSEIERYQISGMIGDFESFASRIPPDHQKVFLQAQTIPDVMARFEAGVVAREAAKAEAKVKAVEAEWRGKLAREEAAHAATRTGGPAAGPSPNGSNGIGSNGALSFDAYMRMPWEERQKLKSTPEGRAKIDAMTRSRAG